MKVAVLTFIAFAYIFFPIHLSYYLSDVSMIFFYSPFVYMILSLLSFLCFWIALTIVDKNNTHFIQGMMAEFLLIGSMSLFILNFHKFDNTPIVLIEKYSAMNGSIVVFTMVTILIFAVLLTASLLALIQEIVMKILK